MPAFARPVVEFEQGVLLVGVRPGYGQLSLSGVHSSKRLVKNDNIELIKVRIPRGSTVEAKMAELASQPGVAFVQPNYKYYLKKIPNDSLYSQQWYLNNSGQNGGLPGADIDAQSAWDIQTGETNIRIAVLDNGIDSSLTDLDDRYLAGFDYVDSDPVPSVAGGDNIDNDGDGSVDELLHHGTTIAGIIGAEPNNLSGLTGIMWNVTLLDVRVFNDDGVGMSDSIALGIQFAVDTGANVINLSFGNGSGAFDNVLASAIDNAFNNNVVVVAAAGNDGGGAVDFPASYSKTIAVGASDRSDRVASFSDAGSELDLVAPGVDIMGYTVGGSGAVSSFDGTSFSAAIVSGAVGILLSEDTNQTPEQIRTILRNTADDIGVPGVDNFAGAGRLNLFRALKYRTLDLTTNTTSVNYPNPLDLRSFTYTTIESDAISRTALIKIFDIKGRLIFQVPSSDIDDSRGKAVWRGVDFSRDRVSTGIYPYYISGPRGSSRGHITVIR